MQVGLTNALGLEATGRRIDYDICFSYELHATGTSVNFTLTHLTTMYTGAT
jgi:hypothetical protein